MAELNTFVALGGLVEHEINCDSMAVSKEEQDALVFGGAVTVHN